jgi:hypothetical protein
MDLQNLEKLGLKKVFFSHAGQYDKIHGTYGSPEAARFLQNMDMSDLGFRPQVSAGYADIGHSNGKGGEHTSGNVLDVGFSGMSKPQIQNLLNWAASQQDVKSLGVTGYDGLNPKIRPLPGHGDHVHITVDPTGGPLVSQPGVTSSGLPTAPSTGSPFIPQLPDPNAIDHVVMNPDGSFTDPSGTINFPAEQSIDYAGKPADNKGIMAQANASLDSVNTPLPTDTVAPYQSMVPAAVDAMSGTMSGIPQPAPPGPNGSTNFLGDVYNSGLNALTGYTDPQLETQQGHGFGSFLGDAGVNLGATVFGGATGAALGSEFPVVGNVAGGIIGGSATAGALGSAREAQQQQIRGQGYNPGKILLQGGLSGALAVPFGGTGGSLLGRVARGAGINSLLGAGSQYVGSAIDQGTLTPNVSPQDLMRGAGYGAILGAAGGLIHGSTPAAKPEDINTTAYNRLKQQAVEAGGLSQAQENLPHGAALPAETKYYHNNIEVTNPIKLGDKVFVTYADGETSLVPQDEVKSVTSPEPYSAPEVAAERVANANENKLNEFKTQAQDGNFLSDASPAPPTPEETPTTGLSGTGTNEALDRLQASTVLSPASVTDPRVIYSAPEPPPVKVGPQVTPDGFVDKTSIVSPTDPNGNTIDNVFNNRQAATRAIGNIGLDKGVVSPYKVGPKQWMLHDSTNDQPVTSQDIPTTPNTEPQQPVEPPSTDLPPIQTPEKPLTPPEGTQTRLIGGNDTNENNVRPKPHDIPHDIPNDLTPVDLKKAPPGLKIVTADQVRAMGKYSPEVVSGFESAIKANQDLSEQSGRVVTYPYRGDRTSKFNDAASTPVNFVVNKQGHVGVFGVNDQHQFITHYLDAHEALGKGIVTGATPTVNPSLTPKFAGSFNKRGRAKAVHTDVAAKTAAKVGQISELLPTSHPAAKELNRLAKLLQPGGQVKDFPEIKASLARLEQSGALDDVLKKIEPITGSC